MQKERVTISSVRHDNNRLIIDYIDRTQLVLWFETLSECIERLHELRDSNARFLIIDLLTERRYWSKNED